MQPWAAAVKGLHCDGKAWRRIFQKKNKTQKWTKNKTKASAGKRWVTGSAGESSGSARRYTCKHYLMAFQISICATGIILTGACVCVCVGGACSIDQALSILNVKSKQCTTTWCLCASLCACCARKPPSEVQRSIPALLQRFLGWIQRLELMGFHSVAVREEVKLARKNKTVPS